MSIGEYVKKGIERKSSLTEVMDRRQSDKIQEYENVKLETLIAEEKKKLQDAAPTKIDHAQTTNFAALLLAGRSTEQVKEILGSLTQEEIDKLAYMSARMDPNNLSNMRGLMNTPSTTAKDIVEAIKIGVEINRKPENNGVSTKDLIDAFKAGIEVSKSQQPANPQPDLQYKLVENTLAELRATREEMSRQDRLRTEKEITELKNRPSGFEELFSNEEKITKARKIFGGADAGVANEFTLRKGEMDQTERLETKKLDWEMKKWELEQENSGKQLEQIGGLVKTVSEGPVAQVIAMLGKRGKEQIRGSETPSSNASQAPPVQIVKVDCPACKGSFPANNQLTKIQCPLCGEQLQNSNVPVAPEEEIQVPASTQLASNPAQEQTKSPAQEKPIDQTVEVESPVEQITKQ